MWELVRSLLFSKEWCNGVGAATRTTSLWNEVEEHVQRGRSGAVVSETLRCGRRVQSVAFKESVQLKLDDLPIGARTLLFSDADTPPELLMRGLNKFPDFSVAAGHLATVTSIVAAATGSQMPSSVSLRVLLQKKLAGFVIHLFSLDGCNVEVVSKHSASGWHAQRGRQLLAEVVGDAGSDGDRNFARALYEGNVVLSCECVDVNNDYQHPVLENLEKSTLVAFSLGVRNTAQEIVAPFDDLRSFCTRFGFRVVDTEDLTKLPGDAWLTRFRDVQMALHDWRSAFEGYVLLIEIPLLSLIAEVTSPLAFHGASSVKSTEVSAPMVVPLRFKMKSNRYRVLRCLRSTVMGEHQISEQHEYYFHPYIAAMRAWILDPEALPRDYNDNGNGEDASREDEPCCDAVCRNRIARNALVPSLGVWRASLLFEGEYLAASRKRRRRTLVDEDNGGAEALHGDYYLGYRELIHTIEQMSLRRARSPHSVVLLCGLPGSGKSTLAAEITKYVSTKAGTPFRHVVVLSRDECARDSMHASSATRNDRGDNAADAAVPMSSPVPAASSVSKHQQRKQQRDAHELYSRRIALAAQWIALRGEDERTLVVLDACHATAESRRHFRGFFPDEMLCALCAYVDVLPEVAAARLTNRSDHVILKQDAARSALQEVMRVFRPPTDTTAQRDFSVVLRCAGDSDAAAMAALVVRCAALQGGAVAHVGGSGGGNGTSSNCCGTGSSIPLVQLRADVVGAVRAAVAVLSPSTAVHEHQVEQLLESQSAVSERARTRIAHAAVLVCGQGKEHEEHLRRTLWQLSAKSLIAAAVGTRRTTTVEPVPWFSGRVFRWVASRLMPSSAAVDGGVATASSLVDGNVKWIVGKFIERDSRTPLGPEHYEALVAGLQQRYAIPDGAPLHVTLAHADGPSGKSEVTSALETLGVAEGQTVLVRLTHLVLDDWAIGFVATADIGSRSISMQQPPSTAVPLHITLGHTHHVNAAYGGVLAARGMKESAPALPQTSHCRVAHNNFARVALPGESDEQSMFMTLRILAASQLGRPNSLSGRIDR